MESNLNEADHNNKTSLSSNLRYLMFGRNVGMMGMMGFKYKTDCHPRGELWKIKPKHKVITSDHLYFTPDPCECMRPTWLIFLAWPAACSVLKGELTWSSLWVGLFLQSMSTDTNRQNSPLQLQVTMRRFNSLLLILNTESRHNPSPTAVHMTILRVLRHKKTHVF